MEFETTATMSAIRQFFLRAKAHQVSFLVTGVSAVGQGVILKSITTIPDGPAGTPFGRLPLAMVASICNSIVLLWLGFLGTSLNEIARPNLRRNTIFFFLALEVAAIYFILLSISVQDPRMLNKIGPLAIVGTVCLFYAVRFVAKGLVMAETGKDSTFAEYVTTLLLLCFFPLGIWVIQPRVNRLYAEKVGGG
jgi:hypothetical protein